jgi:hypothetical protein
MIERLGEARAYGAPEEIVGPEILNDPTVLKALANDIYSAFSANDDETQMNLTPTVSISVEQGAATQELELALGTDPKAPAQDRYSQTLYVVDRAGKKVTPWFTLGSEVATDGRDVLVTEPETLAWIRGTLTTMKEQLTASAQMAAREFDFAAFSQDTIQSQHAAAAKQLELLQGLLDTQSELDTKNPIKYIISATDPWANETRGDDQSFTREFNATEIGSLAEALETVVSPGNQLHYTVYVARGITQQLIPLEVWSPYRRLLASGKTSEQYAIELAQERRNKSAE